MPEVSRFFGIVIRMFVEAGAGHHRPHLHAYFENQSTVIGVDQIERIAGELPNRQQRLVLAWAEIHQLELLANWDRLQQGRPIVPIEPLR